ncbi:MAG: preprotein translocase subunit SecA [Bacteriovoracaceae bacterium]|nr:preprotein translocase subunit SecA [Bacteriovoracaceae bacterium]
MDLNKFLSRLFGTKGARDLKAMRPIIAQINSLEPAMQKLSDSELQGLTSKFRERLAVGEKLDHLIPEAFAAVREASWRVLKMRPFDVQMMGGLALFQGKIAEMKTGEGKTLTATFPLYLHGLTQKGAHLVTVNDYLASRDAEWMGQMLRWMNVSVGCIVTDMEEEARKAAYRCDVTYGTNNEFAFDYLRDNMKFSLDDYVQREHNYCIVDEVDSILIDEARTPLLISGPAEGTTDLYLVANKIIPQLTKDKHFTIDEKNRTAIYTDEGITKLQEILKIKDLFNIQYTELLHHLNQALRAHHLFKRDVDYVVKEGQVIIVDEFTGRLKHGSRWSDGLHQAVEAKEHVKVKQENQTLASITFQNYFRLYKSLAGMTGTADTEAEEFRKIYGLDVVVIPTNKKMIREDLPDVIYRDAQVKYRAVLELITQLHAKGQPVLVGTITIDHSELISEMLKKRGIPHEILNAKNHAREAVIIANAGQKGAVTIATNMAGRGTDIKLGPGVAELGGLFILGTERHEARRIDNQLRGRSGRQGDPGASKFFIALDDQLMRVFGAKRSKLLMNSLGEEPVEHRFLTKAIANAQKKVESQNFEIRKHLLEYDNVMNEQRKVIYTLRRDILSDQANMDFVQEMLEDVAINFAESFRPEHKVTLEQWKWEEIQKKFQQEHNTDYVLTCAECTQHYDADLAKYWNVKAQEILAQKMAQYPAEQVRLATREVLLATFDQQWKNHLLDMDHLKDGIGLRSYAQKDPLTEYKRESFMLFENLRYRIKEAVVKTMFYIRLYTQEEIEEIQRKRQAELEAKLAAHKQAQQQKETGVAAPIKRTTAKVARNDPCPCGSGKIYKHCHGA